MQEVSLVYPLCVEKVEAGAERSVVTESGRVVHSPSHVLDLVNRDLPRFLFYRKNAAEHASSLLTRCHLSEVWRTKLNILLDEGDFRRKVLLEDID